MSTQSRAMPRREWGAFPPVLLPLDDTFIFRRRHVRRSFHQPRKHAANPVLSSGQTPWDAVPLLFGSVRYDPSAVKYRMWYHSCQPVPPGENVHHRTSLALAVSPDGVAWQRARPGARAPRARGRGAADNLLFGSTAREHFIEGGSVLLDPDGPPNRKYLLTYCAFDMQLPRRRDARYYRLAWSADGIHWRRGARLAIRSPGLVDRHALVRDPANGDYLFFFRGEQSFRRPLRTADRAERTVCMQRSPDLASWSTTRVVMAPGEDDPAGVDIYSLMPFYRGGTLLGICQLHDQHREVESVTTHLCWSQDALTWRRRREEFIPLGAPGGWDRFNNAVADGPLIVGDTMHFHYSGRCHRHAGYAPAGRADSGRPFGGIGIASLDLDRFASLSASFDGGSFATRPMRWPRGRRLHVNAQCRWGRIEIAATAQGRTEALGRVHLEGQDGVRLPVDLPIPSDTPPVTLHFSLHNAAVYAIYAD